MPDNGTRLTCEYEYGGAVDVRARSRVRAKPHLIAKYPGEIGKTRVIAAMAAEGALERAWACAASMYDATCYAGDRWLLVGDAGSFLEPLSSFGVKSATFIRDDGIVVGEGVVITERGEPVRFLANVDLVALRDVACVAGTVPEGLDLYQQQIGDAPAPTLHS